MRPSLWGSPLQIGAVHRSVCPSVQSRPISPEQNVIDTLNLDLNSSVARVMTHSFRSQGQSSGSLCPLKSALLRYILHDVRIALLRWGRLTQQCNAVTLLARVYVIISASAQQCSYMYCASPPQCSVWKARQISRISVWRGRGHGSHLGHTSIILVYWHFIVVSLPMSAVVSRTGKLLLLRPTECWWHYTL